VARVTRRWGVVWYRYYRDATIAHRSAFPLAVLLEAVTRPRERAPTKTAMPLWSPAIYAPTARTRSNASVLALSCLVLDYDDGTAPGDATEAWAHVCHAWTPSYSWTDEYPKWRLIVPLAADVPREHYPAVWAWAAARSPGADRQCKDLSRVYYVPCPTAEGAYPHGVHEGPLLDVGHIRAAPPPRRMPPVERRGEWRNEHAEREKDPTWRVSVGMQAGGRETGGRITRATCPRCRQPSAWWWVQPDRWLGAACDHRQSCGWAGGVGDVIG
jgi:hypothetical protein